MCAPINRVSLDDLSFFMDERLSKFNVYNIIVFSIDINDVLPDIIQSMHKYSCSQLIQKCGIDYAKLTFVSHIAFSQFGFYLDRVFTFVRNRRKLNKDSLYYV